jgi:hypothetical protein
MILQRQPRAASAEEPALPGRRGQLEILEDLISDQPELWHPGHP